MVSQNWITCCTDWQWRLLWKRQDLAEEEQNKWVQWDGKSSANKYHLGPNRGVWPRKFCKLLYKMVCFLLALLPDCTSITTIRKMHTVVGLACQTSVKAKETFGSVQKCVVS